MGSWETCLRPDSLDHRRVDMNNTIRQLVRVVANTSKSYKSTWSEQAGILSKKSTCQLESARSVQANAGFPNLYQSAATNLAPGKIGLVDFDPFLLVQGDLKTMFKEIHQELDMEILHDSELGEMSKYYFDGKGKALRPVIAMCVGHAFNHHMGMFGENVKHQRKVALISEMIHTASLVHDDILDHAEIHNVWRLHPCGWLKNSGSNWKPRSCKNSLPGPG